MYVTTDRVLKFGYFETKYHEKTNQLYLGLSASNKKNKTTLFPETLKVEENKMVSWFGGESRRKEELLWIGNTIRWMDKPNYNTRYNGDSLYYQINKNIDKVNVQWLIYALLCSLNLK